MDNLQIWNGVRAVPETALKPIEAGRLKGKSDINPIWRLKVLTEQFGPCGVGWKYEIIEKRLEKGANEEVAAFVDINLYVKFNGEWSAPIPGTGGSTFVAKEKSGLYVNDECFKMGLTDAISVSCKALGVGADVYWQKDATKYNSRPSADQAPAKPPAPRADKAQIDTMVRLAKELEITAPEMKEIIYARTGKNSSKELTPQEASDVIEYLEAQKEAE